MHKQSKAWDSIATSHQQAVNQPLSGKQGSSHVIVSWEDKYYHSEHPALHYTSFYCWAWRHIVWDIPLVIWISCPRCVPSHSPVHPQLLAGKAAQGVGNSVQHCSATIKIWVCNQHYSPNIPNSTKQICMTHT